MAKQVQKKTAKPVAKKEEKKPVKKTPVKSVAKKKTKADLENGYSRTILAAVLIIVILVGGYLAVQYKKTHGTSTYVPTKDEKRFKDEYESLNSVENNKEISILTDNNIKYISMEEAATILDNGDGIIYFGFAGSPGCRLAVPVLLEAMEDLKLDTIYYVNIRPESKKENDLRDEYALDARNKPKLVKDASDSYKKVRLALANYLDDYILITDSGKEVKTSEKRLFAPTVVAVKKGIVVGFHQGVYNKGKEYKDTVENLSKEEEKELLNTYKKIFAKYSDSKCTDDNC